jgi:hypothetical protein
MALQTGGGDFLYEVVEEWGDMPNRWTYDIADVAADSNRGCLLCCAREASDLGRISA